MTALLNFVRSLGLLITRVALGGILIAHGWDRWQVRGIQSQVDYLNQFATPHPLYAAWGSIILELVGGLFLVAGALTPLVALAVLVEQILIICYTSWYRGPYLISPDNQYVGGYEYNVALAALALLFVVFGAGGASVDRLFRRGKVDNDLTDDGPVSTERLPVGAGRA